MPDQPTPKPLTAEEVVDRLVARHVTEGDRIPAAAVADAIRERDEFHAADMRTWIKTAMRCEKRAQESEAESAQLRESLNRIEGERDGFLIALGNASTERDSLRESLAAAEKDTTWQDHADHWQKRAVAAEQKLREYEHYVMTGRNEQHDALVASRDALAAELAEARKVLDLVPKLADGAYFHPGVEVWVNTPDFNEPQYLGSGGHVSGNSYYWCSKAFPWKDCYSTQAAALAARDSGKASGGGNPSAAESQPASKEGGR